jgi:hypothetical protein
MSESKKTTDEMFGVKNGIFWIEEAGEFTHDMIEKLRVESELPPRGSEEFRRMYYGDFNQPEETMNRNAVEEFFARKFGRHPSRDSIGRSYRYNSNDLIDFAIDYAEFIMEQRSEEYREMDLWNFTTIETPEPGECVWACNKGDKEAKRIKWGRGDEAFYSYWMPCKAPVPPK